MQQDVCTAEEARSQMQTMLDNAQRKTADLSSQLSLILTKQQQQLRNEKETKSCLDRMRLDKTRLERELQVCDIKIYIYGGRIVYINTTI